MNPRIIVRKINDFGEQFRPMVTSPFSLSLNEKSAIVKHDGDPRDYLPLLRYPTKPVAGFLPIRDVHNRGATINGLNKMMYLLVIDNFAFLRFICRYFGSCEGVRYHSHCYHKE